MFPIWGRIIAFTSYLKPLPVLTAFGTTVTLLRMPWDISRKFKFLIKLPNTVSMQNRNNEERKTEFKM